MLAPFTHESIRVQEQVPPVAVGRNADVLIEDKRQVTWSKTNERRRSTALRDPSLETCLRESFLAVYFYPRRVEQ
jgi:hypothetical protein